MARKLGQHFITDQHLLKRIVEAASLCSDDVVLEIGAGYGSLTELLCNHAGKVIAIEKDSVLVNHLSNIEADNLEIIHADALDVDYPYFNKIVSNLPYQISSPITFKFFKYGFDLAVLMYQYEFAKRINAQANTRDYSRLSVAAQYFVDARLLFKVSKNVFKPPSAVNSAVVSMRMKKTPRGALDEDFFLDIVRASFAHRRKKLKNSLLANLPINRETLKEVSPSLLNRRAETLNLTEFIQLSNTLIANALDC